MSDDEDPYAVSSDSDDERRKGPPPKVAIEGAKDLKQLVSFHKTFLNKRGQTKFYRDFLAHSHSTHSFAAGGHLFPSFYFPLSHF